MPIEQITPQELQKLMDSGAAVVIDVREIGEYEEAAIEGSVLIPMGQCHPSSMPCNPDKKIVFHCRKGGRSQRVCELYESAYPDRTIYNLAGGIEAWIAQELPCRRGA